MQADRSRSSLARVRRCSTPPHPWRPGPAIGSCLPPCCSTAVTWVAPEPRTWQVSKGFPPDMSAVTCQWWRDADRPPARWKRCVGSAFGTAIRLDPVAVGIDGECRVIVGTVVAAQPRRAVVAAARRQGRIMKVLDALARRCRKAEMQPGFFVGWDRALDGTDPQRHLVAAIAQRTVALAQAGI